MNAFGVVLYLFQYSSSIGRTRLRSTGNGGSQSLKLEAFVIPGYVGVISRSPALIGTMRAI